MSRSSSVVVARLVRPAGDDELDAVRWARGLDGIIVARKFNVDAAVEPADVAVPAAPGVRWVLRDGGTSLRAEVTPLELGQVTAT
jgi:hypothetical protein